MSVTSSSSNLLEAGVGRKRGLSLTDYESLLVIATIGV